MPVLQELHGDRDGLGIYLFLPLRSLRPPPLFRPWSHNKTVIVETAKIEPKTQKNRLFRRFF